MNIIIMTTSLRETLGHLLADGTPVAQDVRDVALGA